MENHPMTICPNCPAVETVLCAHLEGHEPPLCPTHDAEAVAAREVAAAQAEADHRAAVDAAALHRLGLNAPPAGSTVGLNAPSLAADLAARLGGRVTD
jgi:hypothetical protein